MSFLFLYLIFDEMPRFCHSLHSICTPALPPPWFLCHPVPLLCTVMCPPLPPPSSHANHHPSSPPCAAWGRVRVRTCRLPLIWVSEIQFSGRYKPAQCPTTCTFFSSCPLDTRGVCNPAHMVLKVAEITNLSHPTGTLQSLSVITCLLTPF